MRRKLIAGNWKMNGSIVANAKLLEEIKVQLKRNDCDIEVCPPTVYLNQCSSILSGTSIAWGAQDASEHSNGAFTGEVSVAMLKDCGCTHVIVGHSERRAYHCESDELIAKKTLAVMQSGLTPIVCVGETLAQREAGKTNAVVSSQIESVLAVLPVESLAQLVVAYEPVWAIGTGKTATPQMAQEVHALLRALLLAKNPLAGADIKILYGGSMKPDNARELLGMPDIDGGLIGGAALKAVEFLAIIGAANDASNEMRNNAI